MSGISFTHYGEDAHKIGALNGCILSIKKLLDYDFDVLIFSHDDVFINEHYFDVVKKHINSIVNNDYDVICRKPMNVVKSVDLFGGYYSFEVFYISKSAAIKLFSEHPTYKDEQEIPKDFRNIISPEVWFYQLIANKNLKINNIEFQVSVPYNNNLMGTQMGFYHKNADIRSWTE